MTTEKEIKIIEDSVRIIRERTDFEPEIGMILGSGLGDYADKIENPVDHKDLQADYSIATSAKTGQGMEAFKQALLEIIRKEQIYIERLYDFSEAGKIQLIRSKGQLLSEEYVPEGIEVKAYVPQDIYGRL